MSQETPRPPATPQFGSVQPGGPIHAYEPGQDFQVFKRSVADFDNNCYLIRCRHTDESLLIDASAEPDLLADMIGDSRLVGIAQTHGHHDHVRALKDLADRYQVPVYAHPGDDYPAPTEALADGQPLTVGRVTVSAWHVPGHTPGSTAFLVDGFLLSGDTLFPGGPGNTFGDARAFQQIMTSLDRLFELPDDTRICPGHGLDSTIGRERPFVPTWLERGW
ncbi:MAG: hydroxyacylglutathione hydrolase family protein [Actinomycetota bacterium]